MASDFSSGCTEVIEIFDEREEGEISLEDVSSSEEGQLNEGCNSKRKDTGRCPVCLSTKLCASWCSVTTRRSHPKNTTKKDALQEKENCHHTKDSGYSGSKHAASKLQENNNDLIPISSDSDMEIVGLADNIKPTITLPPQTKTAKVKKRRRKKRNQNFSTIADNVTVLNATSSTTSESSYGPKKDALILKDNHLPRIHRRESNSPHKISSSNFTGSRITKSPLRRHRSPFGRSRSPVLRPSRWPRSPIRRSPPKSPMRSPPRRQLRTSVSPSTPIIDMYGNVTELLKKVRHLKTVGTHSGNKTSGKCKGREPSLKDKLNNMLKTNDDSNNLHPETSGKHNSQKNLIENHDDEEDLALLRKMALETKPKRNAQDNKVKEKIIIADDDVEDLELRMIALKSAMLKKKEDRMQRGVVPGKTKKPAISARISTESPFTQSFLDSIPIPGEKKKGEFKTPSPTPIQVLNENTNPEDMELDSEVELEKEKGAEPYSPTDDICRQITVESELLGIQPSDVSFITPTSQVTVLSETSSLQTLPDSEKIEIQKTGTSFLPGNEAAENIDLIFLSQSTYYSNANAFPSSQSPTYSIYSPSNAIEPLGNHFSTPSDDNLPATPYSPSQPIETPQIYYSPENDSFFNQDPTQVPETPYSPTDTPIYDIDLNIPPLFFNSQPFQESDGMSRVIDKPPREKWRKAKHQSALINIKLLPQLPMDNAKQSEANNEAGTSELNSGLSSSLRPEYMVFDKDDRSETSSMKADNGSAFDSPSNSPDSTVITMDELPETDLDGSPLVPVSKEVEDIEIDVPDTSAHGITETTTEPLYLQGVPHVTKDANKIPTLVNKSLVPTSILKSHKNLQQPLPPKKTEVQQEPTFSSANMQPVQISTETNETKPQKNIRLIFRPIQLASVIKKHRLKMTTPSAFNRSFDDNSITGDRVQCNDKKSAQTMKKDKKSRKEALVEIYETIANMKSEPVETTPLSVSEQQINLVHDQAKSCDAAVSCEKEATKNMDEHSGKERRTRARNRRSKRSNKMTQNKSSETKDTINDVPKFITEQTTLTETSSLSKQTLNSNKANKNHSSEDSSQKTSPNEELKQTESESSKRARDERRDRRSARKCEQESKNRKQNDVDKVNDRQTLNKKDQAKGTDMSEDKNHESQNTVSPENSTSQNHCIDSEKMNDIVASKQNIQKNVAISDSSVGESQQSDENPNVTNPMPIEVLTSNRETEDSVADNSTCKKVEASKRRRSSLDDDEEALRAILLASLAKRSKLSDPSNTRTESTALANLSPSSVNTSTESVKGLPDIAGTKVSVDSVYTSSCDSTPTSLRGNQSPNNSSDKDSNSGNTPQVEITNTARTKNIISNNDQIVPSAAPQRKRSISSTAKAPLKKIIKKTPMSASAKVVNNAKKYQNTLVQKKLNLQKVAMITNAQKTLTRNNLHNNNKVADGARQRSMITQPLSDTQRFVINLQSDSESENEIEAVDKNIDVPVNNNRSEPKPVLAIPMSEFEKSVDLFLKDVRKKQETAAAIKPSANVMTKPTSPVTPVLKKSPVASTTPLAVRHLPVSLQEEYRRLKQQILEREKLKLHRVLTNNTSPSSPSSKSSGTPPGPLSPASPIASSTMAKQTSNILQSSSQSSTTTSVKETAARTVSIQNSAKATVPSVTTRVSPVVSKTSAPILPSISNLCIQIPNETTNPNSNSRKSSSPYIPVSNSQTRLVTAVVEVTPDTANTKDSKLLANDQLSLKNVQVQLQQGKKGRKVSLGETLSLPPKTVAVQNEEPEAQESSVVKIIGINHKDKTIATDASSKSVITNPNKTLDAVSVGEKFNDTVDPDASTLIISREEGSKENNTLVDSSTSTVIISRNETADGSKVESVSSESSRVDSGNAKPTTTGQKKLKNNTETWEKIRYDVTKELDAISALPSNEQKSYLATIEQNLVKKRYAILDDLSEISGNLRQLEMEKEVQSNMALEVKNLKEQLRLAEERLQAQRARVNKMVPNVTGIYEKFNNGRRECVKMTRICLGLGCLVIGANYKVPAAGAQLLNNRLKQVAGCTRQLSNKKTTERGRTNEEQQSAKTDLTTGSNIIEKSLNIRLSESASHPLSENRIGKSAESVTIGSVTTTEDPRNDPAEFPASVDAEKTDNQEHETQLLEKTTLTTFMESVSADSPQLTSTPNSLKETSSVDKFLGDTETSTFVLDTPRAGLSGIMDGSVRQRFLGPYKSVLTHLTVPRTSDPVGILCPYELMGTCRDEECQFVHQTARNG